MAAARAEAAFELVGGKLCLDFINTVSGRLPSPRPGRPDYSDRIEHDWLPHLGSLARWGRAAGVLSAAESAALVRAGSGSPVRAARMLARARALREASYRLFVAVQHRWQPEAADLQVFNRELRQARARELLQPKPGGFAWSRDARAGALDRMLGPVVRSAAELLLSDEIERVRRCDGEDCRWLFFDGTRNGSRRWCDMAVCGNVAKVRRFRGRR
jgi:predicted RNA-binding Zn ribbon-like protein